MKDRRQQLWVDSQRQGQFIRHLIGVALISGGLTLLILLIVVWINFRMLESIGLRIVPDIRSSFGWATAELGLAFVLFQAAIIALIIFIGKRISHRITGPIFALKRRLTALRTGDFDSPFRIRKTDFLQGLQQVLENFRLFLHHTETQQKKDFLTLRLLTEKLHHEPTKAKLRAQWTGSDHEEAA